MADRFVTAQEAARLRRNGSPDIPGYARLLEGLDDGQMLRVAMDGLDDDEVEKQNFLTAARSLGVGVGFTKLFEEDNIPYLVVTRNPNTVEPHLPGQ